MSKHYEVKQVILMRTDLRNTQGQKVRSGKLMAQTGHAAMMWLSKRIQEVWAMEEAADYAEDRGTCRSYFNEAEQIWLTGSFAKIVLAVGSEEELQKLVKVAKAAQVNAEICTDNGATEFGGVLTVTCAAIGPAMSTLVDSLTGHLKPL